MPFNIPRIEGHEHNRDVLLIGGVTQPDQKPLERYIAWLQRELAVAKVAWEAITEKAWDTDGPPDAGPLEAK